MLNYIVARVKSGFKVGSPVHLSWDTETGGFIGQLVLSTAAEVSCLLVLLYEL